MTRCRPTATKSTSSVQTHGYEVDLVGARADRLVLATVKRSSVRAVWLRSTSWEPAGIVGSGPFTYC